MKRKYTPLNNLLMTNELVEKTNKPPTSKLKFFPLKCTWGLTRNLNTMTLGLVACQTQIYLGRSV
jgi:hypothetical protein